MFAIAVPSTVHLYKPPVKEDGEPLHYATLNFFHPGDDVSKCRMRLTGEEGDIYEATFNVGGGEVDRWYVSAEELAKAKAEDEAVLAERQREQEAARAQSERELSTADDTTANDLSSDPVYPAPDPQTGGSAPVIYDEEPAHG